MGTEELPARVPDSRTMGLNWSNRSGTCALDWPRIDAVPMNGRPAIIELHTEAECREAYPVVRELRPELDEATYLARVAEAGSPLDCHLFALRNDGAIVTLAGVEVVFTVHEGRDPIVQQMVTTAAERTKGYGQRVMEYVEDYARGRGCRAVSLGSVLRRTDAHRFYRDRMGYTALASEFQKRLD